MEEGTRIIKLSPNAQVTEVTFEDAFGEHSNLRGKGRKRRQNRRVKRRAKFQSEESKAKRRRVRNALLSGGASELVERFKRDRRPARKKMGDEPETEMDNQTAVETGNGSQQSPQNDYQSPSDQAQESTPQDSGGGQSSDNSGGYQPSSRGAYPETVESQEDEGDDEEETDDSTDDEASDDSSDDSGFDGTGTQNDPYSLGEFTMEDFSGFDGDELESSFCNAEGKRKKIHPAVMKLVVEIASRRAKVAALRLEKAAAVGAGDTEKANKLEARIGRNLDRIEKLRALKRKFQSEDRANAEQVNGANTSLKNYVAKKRKNKANQGGSETPTEVELNPKFGANRIDVPAASNAQGPYSNPEDLANDYDAPETRTVELSSSAEGKKGKFNIDWKLVAIGAAIAVGGILVYNKYIKKK
jgi:hypothetical protein